MPPLPSSLQNRRLSFSLKHLFLFSQYSLAPRKFPIPMHLISTKARTISSSASVQSSATDNGSRSSGRRSGALSPSLVAEKVQRIDVNAPKGSRDFPPEDMRLRNWLFTHFREVDYPVLELEALFIREAGEEIRDQLYCFEDRGNRRVALRPELTPSLARPVIQKGMRQNLFLPLSLSSRELESRNQMLAFKVSSRKVLQEVLRCYSVPENLFGKVCFIIDKIEKIPIDESKRELNSTGLSAVAIEELLQVLSIKSLTKLEEILGGAGEAFADLKQLFLLAEKFGFSEWIQFDASVVRGLAYYTGIVFDGFDREGKLRAICGGGQYDRLLSTFGGDDIPACGFGFGDAVIMELLKEKGLLPELSLEVDNIVCALDRDLQGIAATVATKLREKGQSVDLVLESRPLKWVFKRAARTNAQRLILVGNTEWQKGMVSVKILSSGEQYGIKLDEQE